MIDRSKLINRYLIKAKLKNTSALHIGGGLQNYTDTDAPIVRTPDGLPYIPGSSFKGIFRTQAEKLADHINLTACRLVDDSVCISPIQKPGNEIKNNIENLDYLKEHLCDICKLFGSPYLASKIFFKDLYLSSDNDWAGFTQIRDGVVIDRDSERSVDRGKYDFEVVPVDAKFDVEIEIENANENDLQLFI